ncbi:Signal transduction histidine-protein kinase BarA [Gimesia panareensis]|uniref:Sensory/regulatory protein RpfC n=1 Tax=Gimesia panareensis TaxID=2527978 RepID=A0A518FMC1_9PLAN|nr:PAS domain S-box protein [Gimesia panareensis]QDV17516.1 Signal transduction histidine-protein kinase BarA [Gimesia panareensis]
MVPSSNENIPKSALWASDKQLQAIIDSALDAVITMDLDGLVVDWNRRAEEMFGWSYDEVVGNPLVDLIIPDHYRLQHLDGLRLFKSTGKGRVINQKLELTALRRNGHEFPIELVVTKVEWKQQTIFNAFVRDVSDRKEAEQLIAREKLEAALLQQASFASSTSDALEDALRICVANLGEISGWPVGHAFILNQNGTRLVSSRIWHFSHRDNFRSLSDASEQLAVSRGEDLPGQVWQRGEPVWITDIEHDQSLRGQRDFSHLGVRSAFGFPVKLDGEVIAVVEFFNTRLTTPDLNLLALARGVGNLIRHVIERVQWQEERTLLAAIVESSGDAIIGKAPDGTITSWNNGAEETYGWLAEEVIGETVSLLLPPGMAREESEILEAMKTGRRLDQFQTRRVRKDGTLIDVSISVSPIRGMDNQIVGTSTIERDITARRRREEELSKARDEAEQATRTQSEFLANVSHELRTPMNAILGMLELTLQEDLTPLKRDYLQTAKDSADSLLLLVNDILDFSRLEAGRFELEPVPFNLRDLLDEAVKTLSLRACEKGLELICRIDRRVPGRVIGDPVRLRQILTNLAGNAIKFTEQGEVVVNVKLVDQFDSIISDGTDSTQARFGSLPGEQVMLDFSVTDTGIGIAPEDQERIFAPFAQADASTTRHYSGTGLGLAICHELIGLMKGEMYLESTLGQGSCFSFQIACSVADPDETDTVRERSRVSELKDLPVLVVDDNQTNRVILEEMLTNWSMSPTPVDSAQEALEKLSSTRRDDTGYPLVIVDALMPETDGFMLLEQAKDEGLLDTATILMLSSADHQIFGDRCRDLEISAFLEKPISQSDLLDAIMTALKGPQLEQNGVVQISETKQSLRVLIAEDTPANQKVITAILKKRGHQCVIANNGREAVDWVRNDTFDAVLMDVQMPTMDGLQATKMIREYEQEAEIHVPIIAMTAYAMRGDRDKCISAGMDNYISKPIDAPKLIRLLERLATKYPRRASLTPETFGEELLSVGESPEEETQNSAGSSEKPGSSSTVFDMAAALKRVGNDPEILNSMVEYFFEDAPVLLKEISRQTQVGDADELARAAHSLKGLCANFNANTAAEAAKAIEEMGYQGDLQDAPEAIPALKAEVDRLTRELTQWRTEA